MNGNVCGCSALFESRNSIVSGLPFGSINVPPSRLQPADSSRS